MIQKHTINNASFNLIMILNDVTIRLKEQNRKPYSRN